jgi:hypothetical protein
MTRDTSFGARPLSRAVFFACSLGACGASVRGAEPAPRDASVTDASLGPIEGCPSRTGSPRGRWETLTTPEDLSPRAGAVVLAADRSLVILGGSGDRAVATDSWRFDADTNQWSRLSSAGLTPSSRYLAAVWMPETREVFLWSNLERRGARLSLDGGARALPTENAPRTFVQRAVWVAGQVFLGGSTHEGDHDEFTLYDPRTDRWETVLAPREQTSRGSYAMVASAREVLVWGGSDATTGTGPPRDDGWRFDVPTRRWSSVSRVNAPAPRWGHRAWWIGDAALVWGGSDSSRIQRGGGLYSPAPDAWRPTTALGAPGPSESSGSFEHHAVWTGSDLFAWTLASNGASRAGRYDPRADQWFPADPPPQAASRRESASVWLNCALYVVGGRDVTRWAFTREVIRWVP